MLRLYGLLNVLSIHDFGIFVFFQVCLDDSSLQLSLYRNYNFLHLSQYLSCSSCRGVRGTANIRFSVSLIPWIFLINLSPTRIYQKQQSSKSTCLIKPANFPQILGTQFIIYQFTKKRHEERSVPRPSLNRIGNSMLTSSGFLSNHLTSLLAVYSRVCLCRSGTG